MIRPTNRDYSAFYQGEFKDAYYQILSELDGIHEKVALYLLQILCNEILDCREDAYWQSFENFDVDKFVLLKSLKKLQNFIIKDQKLDKTVKRSFYSTAFATRQYFQVQTPSVQVLVDTLLNEGHSRWQWILVLVELIDVLLGKQHQDDPYFWKTIVAILEDVRQAIEIDCKTRSQFKTVEKMQYQVRELQSKVERLENELEDEEEEHEEEDYEDGDDYFDDDCENNEPASDNKACTLEDLSNKIDRLSRNLSDIAASLEQN